MSKNTIPTRYKEYLDSEDWKKLKSKIIKRDGGVCQGCFESRPLDVHHLTYDRIGEELGTDLVSLCRYCHDKIHNNAHYHSRWNDYITGKTDKAPKPLTRDEMIDIIIGGAA